MDLSPEEMMPVPIEDLVNGVKTPCDLFVRLNQEKFVMVAKSGTTTQVEQLRNFKDKEVPYLWVIRKEYYKMVHQTTTIAGVLVDRRDVDDGSKTQIVTKAARTIFNQIDNLGLDLNTYSSARQISEAILTLSEHHKGLSTLLESLKTSSDTLLAHSVAVSILSTLIGQEVGYEKKVTLEKLALGGLLHDIGLKSLPKYLLEKAIVSMSNEEILHWETHSFKGMQMLRALGIVPDDVVAMVYEHHENSIGQGFPQHIRDVKLHPLAKVTQLADQFASLILPGPNIAKTKSAREAMVYIEITMGQPFNKEIFRALKRIVESERIKVA
jgi:putative nucleotidyltransferase with HDIG domain